MKRILYISYDGMTDQLGQSQVIPYLRELTKAGYRFHILSVEKKARLEKTGEQIRAMLQQAGIEWTTMTYSKRPPFLSKLYDQWRLNAKAAGICRKEKIDMVHCRSYVPAAAGLKLSKRFAIPFLFDMRGFWVDERVDSGLWKLDNPLYRFLYKSYKLKERNYFSGSAHIISLTWKGKEELTATYKIAPEKITVIPCCADMDHFDFHRFNSEQVAAIRRELGIAEGKKVLSYLGSLGGWYMTDEMLDFFAVMQKQIPESVFLIVTHDEKAPILAKAAAKGIPGAAVIVQPAGRDEVPVYLSVSDWNIFFIKDAYSKKASSPTKQGEVMAMGIPIICNDIGDTGKIIRESGAGIIIAGFETEEYGRVCDLLLHMAATDREKIRREAIRHYDLGLGVNEYRTVYEKLLN
jgi:glycosyltransferase involved in cell wall biosynthesis